MARPTKLTDETRDRLALLISAGNTLEIAVQAAGIGESTFYEWMERGERGADAAKTARADVPYRDFYLAVEKARGEAEAIHVAVISKAARNGSWQAALALLERRFPDRWIKATDRKKLGAAAEADQDKPADPFDALDELAPRRQARDA